ncbi:hypothetical protein CEUSTIGMA_g597.t1 [Chlamydomonas eustigma]|uniref:YGGT family protein n=1 Tax=Chlamydomonas eustigma TaxID=1157962 RepID=A0A250WQL4_9CHLO|nr:hypothetical protein CEUSTIGMA_g597.t1 [Chlamydomonas eustigma]|eukprot:GAX73144.1 hypothetical protein CEUSTIGMA_g597.t1 [Chlamydomonas eustigma]
MISTPTTSRPATMLGKGEIPGALAPTVLLITSIFKLCQNAVEKIQNSVASAFPHVANMNSEVVQQQLKQLYSHARVMAFLAPLAKAASSDSLTAVYTRTFERAAFGFAKMYLFLLFMRVLLSWFPSIDWNANPWTFLRLITEPYLQIYRGILPPLFGQLDFTPLFGFLILQDVVEVMAPTYTMGMHAADTSTRWTTSDVMCYFDGF